jgi:6-phosphogluconolactonase
MIPMPVSRRSFLSLVSSAPALFAARRAKEYWVYFGTSTRKASKGIYVSRLNVATGSLTEPQLAAEASNPNTQAIHPGGRFLYSVVDAGGGAQGGVASFSVDPATGKLTHTGEVPSHGVQPIYLAVDSGGRTVAVPNYSSGSVAAIPIRKDGSVGESASFIQHEGSSVNPTRQTGPHAHAVAISPDGRFLIVPDLGLDKTFIYRLDAAQAKIEPNDPPFLKATPGSGPRHFAFHPKRPLAYLISELSNSVTALRWDARRGSLEELQTLSNLPEGFKGTNSTAEIVVHPSGKFVYGSNRGHNSINVYAIQPDGKLQVLENISTAGRTPNNFAIDPTGRWLLAANQMSDNIVAFSIEGDGRLKPTGQTLGVDTPMCVRFLAI